MVPIPRAASWEALNEQFMRDALARRARRLRGHQETIGERFERDRAALLPLPAARFEACDKTTVRVSSISLVRYRTNDYSVPTEFGHRQVLVKAFVHRIVIVAGCDVIAEHKRSYEREATIYDPLHYLALLEHKSRALDQAAPLAGWQLPECFVQLRRLLEARLLKDAAREYIQVLRLLENILLLGNSGTGKSHIALALGLAACQRGHRVRFITAAALVSELIEARDEKYLRRFQKQLAAHELLIIDELGYVPLSKTGAELLFETISQRYERASTLITSNLPFDEWTELFGSERLTGALLDRITHHVHILEMNADSYRLKQSRRKRTPPQTR